MGMPVLRKDKHRISVRHQAYLWHVEDQLGSCQLLVVVPICQPHTRLEAFFEYHFVLYKEVRHPDGGVTRLGRGTFTMTQAVVRQVIDFALNQGWEPCIAGATLELGSMDDRVDLGIDNSGEQAF